MRSLGNRTEHGPLALSDGVLEDNVRHLSIGRTLLVLHLSVIQSSSGSSIRLRAKGKTEICQDHAAAD